MENLVLYPAPGIGHLISMVELGKLLLSHSCSISSITILIIDFPYTSGSYSSYISCVSSSFPSITFLSLPFVPLINGDPSNYPNFEQIVFETIQNNNPNVLESFKSLSLSSQVSAFIVDMICYPSVEISQSMNIPTYFFCASGASVFAFALNFPIYDKLYSDSFRNLNVSLEIPGLFTVPSSHVIESMLDRGESYDEFVKMARILPKVDGAIINTFDSLEVRAVKGLNQGTCFPSGTIPPVYCIGPLIANRGDNGDSKHQERHGCLSWLDTQPSRSVVYLGFGSRGVFSKEQLCEIALGLENSGVKFLWVVRSPPSASDQSGASAPPEPDLGAILPEGFLERTKDRGLVVKSWVPQIEVLGHGSVGGFVTHCGWNSTLEAVVLGVPMVAWPLYAEQRFNKILLVEEIGIALPMNESEDRFVTSSEIEKRVRQILESEDDGEVVRRRVLDLKERGRNSLNEGCSSYVSFNKLLESWRI